MDELLDLLKREQKAGCQDSAVFGGFAVFLKDWGMRHQSPELVRLADEYTVTPVAARPGVLARMEQVIFALPPMEKSPFLTTEKREDKTSEQPLTVLAGFGAKRAELFGKLGVKTLMDLLFLLPRDYRDRRAVSPVATLALNSTVSVRGRILSCESVPTRRGISILKCYIRDDSGILPLLWFNQPFLQKKLQPGMDVLAYGKIEKRYDAPEMTVQDYQILSPGTPSPGGILPVYPGTEGLPQKMIRSAVEAAWAKCEGHIPELIPETLRKKRGLMTRNDAIRTLHFPESFDELEQARRTLAYEEFLVLQLVVNANAMPTEQVERPDTGTDNAALLQEFYHALPFAFTGAQDRVVKEIYSDMDGTVPMSRLVQGDVGSGKTAVAAAAIFKCCRRGQQAAMMAPTEILAGQHYQSLKELLSKLGLQVGLLTGSTKAAERKDILVRLAAGELDCLIGTHALIQDSVVFRDLGLAITDEQHRFGVMQRAKLRKNGVADLLIMTATPIPRTLAMTVYADQKLSVIDELPPGRKPVDTYAVPYSYETRIHNFIDKQVKAGRQAFIVCPLVQISEKTDLDSAVALHERLQKKVFPHLKVALLHGKMKPQEKEEIMAGFYRGETHILVSTTVVEVGVNVPNATVMVIRDAERFGLAQLHQLRGRIGRGSEQSYCILLHTAETAVAQERMRIISSTSDGFALAEADLKQRGPGEIFGERQHGLPELKVGDVFRDADLLAAAHGDAPILTAEGIPAALKKEQERLSRLMV